MARRPPLRYRSGASWKGEGGRWANPPTGPYRGRNNVVYKRPPADVRRALAKAERERERAAAAKAARARERAVKEAARERARRARPYGTRFDASIGRWRDERGAIRRAPDAVDLANRIAELLGGGASGTADDDGKRIVVVARFPSERDPADLPGYEVIAPIWRELAGETFWHQAIGLDYDVKPYNLVFTEEQMRSAALRRGGPVWMSQRYIGYQGWEEILEVHAEASTFWEKYKEARTVGLILSFY